MTKNEVEMAMIQMGRALKTIVGSFAPNANHMDISVVNGTISVSACQYDGSKMEYIEKDILNATEFEDGVLLINGKYIRPEK